MQRECRKPPRFQPIPPVEHTMPNQKRRATNYASWAMHTRQMCRMRRSSGELFGRLALVWRATWKLGWLVQSSLEDTQRLEARESSPTVRFGVLATPYRYARSNQSGHGKALAPGVMAGQHQRRDRLGHDLNTGGSSPRHETRIQQQIPRSHHRRAMNSPVTTHRERRISRAS